MALEPTVASTDVIEVPIEAKTIVINPPSDGSIVPEVTTNGDATTVAVPLSTETEAVVGEKPEEKKVVNPREEPVEWIKSLISPAVHKVNHQILTWLQNQTYATEEEKQPLPGKNDAITKTQFINFLKDGTLLAKFANVLSPGAIEKVYEGEEAKAKENQVTNVQNFVNFVKEKAGFPETEVFTVDDLQENGKSGYNPVFNTIFLLGMKAQEKFNANGIDVDAVIEAASVAAKNSLIQTIWDFFKRVRPQLKSKNETSDEKTTPIVNGANGNGVVTEEIPVTNVVPVATTNGDAKVAEDIPPPVPTTAAPVAQ